MRLLPVAEKRAARKTVSADQRIQVDLFGEMKVNVIGYPPDPFRRIFRNGLPDRVLADLMQEK